MRTRDQIMLLGDSITEYGFGDNGFAARLAETYVRKLDVINRGYDGYNAVWDSMIFRDLFPTVEEQKHYPRIVLLTVWLGTNDATFPGSSEHVPLDQFAAALKDIFGVVRERSPQTKIVLITPPPIYTPVVQELVNDRNDPPTEMNRSAEMQGTYVQAVKDIGREEKIPVVDAWEPIWEAAGSKQPEAVMPFLSDGLHLNGKGYEIVFKGLMEVIKTHYPELAPNALPLDYPNWKDVDPENPKAALLR